MLPTTNQYLEGDSGFPEHLSANDCLQARNRHVIQVIGRALRYRIVRLTGDVLPALQHLILHLRGDASFSNVSDIVYILRREK